jgi:hypothetical protein
MRMPNKDEVYRDLKTRFLDPAVEAIENGDNNAAHAVYEGMMDYAMTLIERQ